jgi:hypothetical protein
MWGKKKTTEVYLGVGLNVSQEIDEGSGGLQRPADLVADSLVLLGDGVTSNTTSVLGEGNGILELQHVLQVVLGVGKSASLDGLTDFAAMLEMDAEVGSTGLGGFGVVIGLLAVLK